MDQAQIYKIIRSLTAQGLIQRVPDDGAAVREPKVVVYELTGLGRAAVAATAAIATAAMRSENGGSTGEEVPEGSPA
jgi:DNA-binding PadR family transcriptional regulator